jgi:hypothetical protein
MRGYMSISAPHLFYYFTGSGSFRLRYNHLAIACVQAYWAIKMNLVVIII